MGLDRDSMGMLVGLELQLITVINESARSARETKRDYAIYHNIHTGRTDARPDAPFDSNPSAAYAGTVRYIGSRLPAERRAEYEYKQKKGQDALIDALTAIVRKTAGEEGA